MRKMINLTGSWKQDMIIRQVGDLTLWFPINVTLVILFSIVVSVFVLLLALPVLGVGLRYILIEQNIMFTLSGLIGITYVLNKAKIDGKTPVRFIGTVVKYICQLALCIFGEVQRYLYFLKSLENVILFEVKKKGGV